MFNQRCVPQAPWELLPDAVHTMSMRATYEGATGDNQTSQVAPTGGCRVLMSDVADALRYVDTNAPFASTQRMR
jgi:hypothetical protein